MNNQNGTKKPCSSRAKLIDIQSSDSETSACETADNDIIKKRFIRMTKSQSESKLKSNSSSHSDYLKSYSDSEKQLSLDNNLQTAEIDIDQVQIYPESKWSISGGSVLGLLTSSIDNDYSLWIRIKEKQKIKEANSSFFSSTIFSLFSGSTKEKYSFDDILISNDIKPKINVSNNSNQERFIDKKENNYYIQKDRKSIKSNNRNLKKMKNTESFVCKSETQKLMLNNGALCATTNINLNDEDDENDFLSHEKERTNLCDLSLYKGIFYSLLSSLFFSLSCMIVKYLKNIHPGQLAVVRYIGILVLSIPLIIYHRQSPFGPPDMRHILVLRGISGASSLFLRFYAFRYLPLADASVIVFAIPIFVSIFGHFFLNEPCGLFQTFIVILAMFGLMLSTKLPFIFGDSVTPYSLVKNTIRSNYTSSGNVIVQQMTNVFEQITPDPIDKDKHILGVSAGLASLLFASAVFVFIRKAKGVHYSVIMVWFGAVAIIETTILTLFLHGFSLPQNAFEWRLMIFLAVFAFCGQILLTRALQLEYACSVSVARSTSDIAFGFLWQIAIFNELPDGYSIIGALLVSSCIFLITLKNWVNSLPEHSHIRSQLRFVTY